MVSDQELQFIRQFIGNRSCHQVFWSAGNAIGNVRAGKLLDRFCPNKFQDFFSGYGMLTVNLPDKIVYLLALTAIIGVWGIILSEKENPLRSLLKGFSLIILFGHIIVNLNVEAFHARDLFIGMVPFSLLFVDGVRIWLKELLSGKVVV